MTQKSLVAVLLCCSTSVALTELLQANHGVADVMQLICGMYEGLLEIAQWLEGNGTAKKD